MRADGDHSNENSMICRELCVSRILINSIPLCQMVRVSLLIYSPVTIKNQTVKNLPAMWET